MKLPSMRQATMDFQYVPKGPIRINQGQLHDYVICLFSGVDAFSGGLDHCGPPGRPDAHGFFVVAGRRGLVSYPHVKGV